MFLLLFFPTSLCGVFVFRLHSRRRRRRRVRPPSAARPCRHQTPTNSHQPTHTQRQRTPSSTAHHPTTPPNAHQTAPTNSHQPMPTHTKQRPRGARNRGRALAVAARAFGRPRFCVEGSSLLVSRGAVSPWQGRALEGGACSRGLWR